LLAAHFGDAAARRLGLAGARFSDHARRQLESAEWPGNVRELENVVSRGVLRASAGGRTRDAVLVESAHLDVTASDATRTSEMTAIVPERSGPLDELVGQYEREVILSSVKRHGGNWAAAARDLGLHRSNLHRRAQRLGLKEISRD
jgi:anaerobic nitric oxide reductase transcription regulator